MKYILHIIFLMLLFVSLKGHAQDKVFLRNGKVITCKIMEISEKALTYKDTAVNAPLVTLPRKDVLLAEYQNGQVYMFSQEPPPTDFKVINGNTNLPSNTDTPVNFNETREQRNARKMKEWKEQEALLPNNILGFYIPELVLGRLTVSYERLLANKSMGIKIPFSLTYDALGALSEFSSNNANASSTNTNSTNGGSSSTNTTNGPVKRNRGTGFITGVDVNYYYDLKPKLKYYFGPRIRYGTDMMLGGIEGLTFQLQNGIFKSSGKRMTSTVGFGVGFFKLSAKYANRGAFDTKQVYPWASFTWRLGFRL
ncbi:MAG: hypothetical protein HY062_06525 [Bacteroidetes bacterium]|nr:hypothetical protein [Bacteroidota bacterium]